MRLLCLVAVVVVFFFIFWKVLSVIGYVVIS